MFTKQYKGINENVFQLILITDKKTNLLKFDSKYQLYLSHMCSYSY